MLLAYIKSEASLHSVLKHRHLQGEITEKSNTRPRNKSLSPSKEGMTRIALEKPVQNLHFKTLKRHTRCKETRSPKRSPRPGPAQANSTARMSMGGIEQGGIEGQTQTPLPCPLLS